MASREKKPLAPSKSKQKASNDPVLPSNEVKNKKGKSLPNIKQQQLAQEIFDTVATGSQFPVKLEASLPRRNALKNLKRKQNLRAAKTNLIKSKVTKRVTNRDIHRVAPDVKKGAKGAKKVRQTEESIVRAVEATLKLSENQINNGDNEGKGTETPSKSAKSNLRTKKTKSDIQGKEEVGAASTAKVSPKFGRKGKTSESPDSLSKSAKTVKLTSLKKNTALVKVNETDNKSGKNRKSIGKELDCGNSARNNTNVERFSKTPLDNKNSIDLTIDEVIASMLSDTEEGQQSVTEKAEGKVTRSKKMLVEESNTCDIEIKKEPDVDDTKFTSDGESVETDQGFHFQNAIQLRKRSKVGYIDQISQRSLRNGKQRQLSDLGNIADNDSKKRHRLNSDGTTMSDNLMEHISDCNINMDSCFSDPSNNESQSMLTLNKDEICSKDEASNIDEDIDTGSEVETNNNGDRMDRSGETGPILRSKTKAKTIEFEARDDDIKTEDTRIISRCAETQEDSKALSFEQVKKDNILAKFADKSKGRRSSLNIDIKKTVNSFYNTDKSDSKSDIDQMIEEVKLNIAKSIENKIFGPEKSLGLNKNFDVPKIEEIIAPLSTESQKMGLEDNTDEDKSTVTKNEITSDNSENSVPLVADTAKEIEEKLVKFDIEEAETHSQNIQERASDNDRTNDVHNNREATCNINNNNNSNNNNATQQSQKSIAESDEKNVGCSTASGALVNVNNNESKTDENKKITRKSSRINDKNSDGINNETRKSNRTPNKTRSDNTDDSLLEIHKSTSEETISKSEPLDDTSASASISSEDIDAEERLTEEQTREITESFLETEISIKTMDNAEETETLESISREVEKLVAEDQFIKILSSTNDTIQNKDIISDATIPDKDQEKENDQEASAHCDELATSEPIVNDTNEAPNKSFIDGKSTDANETLRENDASCKTTQRRSKVNNNLLPTAVNCDSNSECSFVNSSSVHSTSDRLNDEAKEHDQNNDHKELNKSDVNERISEEKPGHNEAALATDQSNKISDDKGNISDERKLVNEENRRVLRARDKQKKIENRQIASRGRDSADSVKVKTEDANAIQKTQVSGLHNTDEMTGDGSMDGIESSQKTEDGHNSLNSNELDISDLEPQARNRRGREVKKRKEELLPLHNSKTKRVKRDLRKSDQQNKEETLLDNEVAKINENDRSFLSKYGNASANAGTNANSDGNVSVKRADSFREFFDQNRQDGLDKVDKDPKLRSKSENDIMIVNAKASKNEKRQLSRNLSENYVSQERIDNIDMLENERKTLKTPELANKDSDETSTSGESFNSGTPKILETPEDKERKESILRLLGLESLEEAAKRQNQQKTKKEQSSSTGTLKTIIRVSQKEKEKDKDKRGSRSPLKMVLKQQGRGDGEGDSPEFYTIQKEFGTSGLGDSSSGANRKFTTNHRHSCDDDNEEAAPKDRQSLVIPEKSSSFSIHPGRVCADVCCYCFGKFGSLDTPMHLAQIKSDERRKKILNIERHLTKDSCLCDACYRHVDRKANTSPTNLQQKPQKQHRQLMVLKCSARECRDPARHHVKRRWLLKIKPGLQNQVDIDWDSSQHTTMSFCVNHYEKVGRFLTCALCKRRLTRQHTYQLTNAEIDDLNHLLGAQGIPVTLAVGTFVCKLCRYFAQLQVKYRDIENMNTTHRGYCKNYRKRILHYLGIDVIDDEDEDSSQNHTKDKKTKKSIKNLQPKNGSSKSPERTMSGTSEKSTPEPNKNENSAECSSEMGNDSHGSKSINDENGSLDVHYLENLKKRKILDMHSYTPATSISPLCDGVITNGIFEMDEVTLTRLPKKSKPGNNNINNDITPVVQRLGANPSISVRTLFPGEEEMNLHVNIEFQNVREVTPQGWEKCATMIQYDRETKHLWQQLQRPYGNQSSFLRHLILLEKYYRAGDLILAPNASRNAINYSTSVQNRLISYEGPEKMDEPIMEPIATEYTNPRRLSGGYMVEKDRLSLPSTSLISRTSGNTSHSIKGNPPRMLKLNSGVSIIKKSPPNLQRLNLPSTSGSGGNGKGNNSNSNNSSNSGNGSNSTVNSTAKRKDLSSVYGSGGGKIFQLNEPDMRRMQTLKRQKLNDRSVAGANNGSTSGNFRSQYQKTQMAVSGHNQQFHRHVRMQQEMLSRQSRGDFEPLICDITRSTCTNENSPTAGQNVLHNFNLPKSIQVTTKPTSSTSNPIPILPKIPKSLTVIPQTVTRSIEK